MKEVLKRGLFWLIAPIYLPLAWFKAWRLARKKIKIGDDYDGDRAYKFIRRVANFVKTILNLKLDIDGFDKWTYAPGLIVANHQSNIDGVLVMLMLLTNDKHPNQIAFIAKEELEQDKLYGPFLKCISTYFINRENAREVIEIFEKAKQEMTTKRQSLVIFPEGTRSNGKEMGKFHPGAFKLAIQSYVPVKPLTLIDTYKYREKDSKGNRVIKIICDEELPADQVISMNTIGLSNFLWEKINANIQKYSSDTNDSNTKENDSKIKKDTKVDKK